MGEDGHKSNAIKDITFGSVGGKRFLSRSKLVLTAFSPDRFQVAGMTSKLFEHPFDLGESAQPLTYQRAPALIVMGLNTMTSVLQSKSDSSLNLPIARHLSRVPSTALGRP
jgi:hypothetical protein